MDNSLELILKIKTENAATLKALEADMRKLGTTAEEVTRKQQIETKKSVDVLLTRIAAVKNLESAKGKQLMDQLAMLDKVTAAEVRAGVAAAKAAEEAAKAADKRDKAYRQLAATMSAAAREDQKRSQAGLADMAAAERGAAQLARGMGLVNYQATSLANGAAGLTGAFGTMGVVLASVSAGMVLGAKAAYDLVKQYGEAEREIANLSQRLGLTVQQGERLTAMAGVAGVSISSLEQSARLLGEALDHPDEQGKKVSKSLRDLGISTHDLSGKMLDLGPVVLQVLEKLSLVSDDARRAALGTELLGRGAKELQPLIGNYAELQRVVASFHVGEDAAGSKELLKANENVKELSLSWDQFKKHLAETIAPIVIPIVQQLTPGGAIHPTNRFLDPAGAISFGLSEFPNQVRRQQNAVLDDAQRRGLDAMRDTTTAAAFAARTSNTKENLEAQLKAAVKTRDEAHAAASSGDLGASAEKSKIAEYDAAAASVKKIQAALDAIKESKKEEKQQDQELIDLQQELGRLQAKELDGVDAILAKHNAVIAALEKKNKLNAQSRAVEDAIYGTELQTYRSKTLPKQILEAGERADREITPNIGRQDRVLGKDAESVFADPEMIRKALEDFERGQKARATGDASDADQVRSRLGTSIRGFRSSGNYSQSGASNAEYTARINAANEVYAIETRRLDQITDEGKREELIATARKKQADEIAEAEAKHEEELQAQRLKDLDEYKTFFVGLMDAAFEQHRMSNAIQKYMKGFAHQILNTVAANVTGVIFGNGGKGVPALNIPGQTNSSGQLTTLGKVLQGIPGIGHGSNPQSQATVAATTHLTTSTDLLKESVDRLNSTLQGKSGTTGGGGGNIPGLPSLGGISIGGDASSVPDVDAADITNDGLPTNGGGMNGQLTLGMPPVTAGTTTPGFGGYATDAMAIGGGALQAASGFSKGGASGIASGIGGTLMAGAGIAAMVGGPVGMAVGAGMAIAAAGADLLSAFLSTGPQKRAQDINNELGKNAYLAPTALNVTQGMNGTFEDFDARGNIRTSTMSAVPTVLEPYITSQHLNGASSANSTYYNSPGGQTSPYSGFATGTGQAPVSNAPTIVNHNYNISAMDAQSFHEFMQRPSSQQANGDSIASHLQTTEGRLSNAIRFIAG